MATPTPLFNAAHVGDRATLQKLLATSNATTTINAKFGQDSLTALHVAIDCGHTECALDLIEAGADVNSTMTYSVTPLMAAAFHVNSDVATKLVQAGANVDATADNCATALALAARNGCLPIVKLLVDARADVSLGEAHGVAPLLAAARAGHAECIRLLLDAGAKLSTKTSGGATALSIAATEGHKPCVELLLQRGATVDVRKGNGVAPLLLAASRGHKGCTELLLEAGASVDVEGTSLRHTPLHEAASGGHKDCVSLLLAFGAKLKRDTSGQTAVHKAALAGHHACLALLASAGANMAQRDNRGRTALQLAAEGGHDQCASLLLQAGLGVNGPNPWLKERALQLLEFAVAAIIEVACVHFLGVMYGMLLGILIYWVVSCGLCVLLGDAYDGKPPLLLATMGGHASCVSLLLQAGANVGAVDGGGDTAMHYAAAAGHLPVATLLLQAGASLTVTNRDHLSPLDVAVQERQPQLVRLLAAAAKQFSVNPEVCRPRTVTFPFEARQEARQPATMKAVQGESRWRRRRGLALLREQRVAARDARNARLVHKHVAVE